MSEETKAAPIKIALTLRVVTSVLVALSLAVLVSCGGGGGSNTPPPPTITSVSVTCSPTSIQTGQTSECSATATGTGSYSSAVTWSASAGTIDASGKFTAPATAGSVTVTAQSTEDTTKSGSTTVTVTVPPTITSVSVTCSPSAILMSQTSTCAATVQGTGAYDSTVTWTATDGTITSSGVFTPASSGTATITATSTQDTTKSSTAQVAVATPTALAITISDLPTGALANVTVTDPNGQQTKLTSSQIINAIPGTYTLTAAPVVVGTSTYHATQTIQTVTVASGGASTVTVDYYNIIPNTTKVLDHTGAQNLIVSSDGSTLTISGASPVANSLQPGDVLAIAPVTAAPNGLLVKVVTANVTGSTVTVATTPATLADEVTQARFGVDIPFVLSSTSAASRGHAGYGIRTNQSARPQTVSLTNPCAEAAQSLSLPFSYSLPPDANQNTLTASGELDFCNLHVDYDIRPLSTYAKVTVSLQQYSSLVVQGQYSTSFEWDEPLDLSELESQVVCLGNETCQAVLGLPDSIGNALEVVTPSITPFVGMQGSASGGLYLGGAETGSFQAGVQVQGVAASPIYNGTLQQVSFPTAVDGALDVKGYFGVTLGFTLLGSVTAHVDPRAYAELKADTGANPWWTLSLGDEAKAGVTLSFLGFGSSEHDTQEYTIYSGQLAQASGPYSVQPTISTLTPNSATAGTSGLTLSLTGSNFVPGCYVSFGGNKLQTSFEDPTDLTAVLPFANLLVDGLYPVTVSNPDISGAVSPAVNFAVTGALVSISPPSAQVPAHGLQQFTATVIGPPNTAVTWSVNSVVGGNSTVGAIAAAGLYTAPATVPNPATVTVTATSRAFPSFSGSASVTIGPYTETPVYSFTSLNDGAAPSAPLTLGNDRYFYGTAQVGGQYGYGTVFKVDSSGKVTPLHEFSGTDDGAYPAAALVQGSDGYFYGVTFSGGNSSCTLITDFGDFTGCGTIFKVDSSGILTPLHPFSGGTEGGGASAGLIVGSDGYFYGTTSYGGSQNAGTVFKSDASGTVNTLYSFSGGTDGWRPFGSLIQADDGNFYGTTQLGGDFSCAIWSTYGCGTIFKIDSVGTLNTLYSFTGGADGADPEEALIQAGDGYLYGTTLFGGDTSCTVSGATGCGTIFKINLAGSFTSMHQFSGLSEGGVPFSALVQASDGDFYGTATAGGDPSCSVYASGESYSTYIGCGTVFKMDSSGNVSALYSFTGSPSDGSNPFAAVVEGSDGYLYGTTRWGGTDSTCPYTDNGGCGTVFKVSGPGGPLPPLRTGESKRSVPISLNLVPLTLQVRPVPKAQAGQKVPRVQRTVGSKQPAIVK